MLPIRSTLSVLSLSLLVACTSRQPEVTPQTPAIQEEAEAPTYIPSPTPLEGPLKSVGSDSMDPLVQLWVSDFTRLHPGVTVDLQSKGSGTAPKALTGGQTLLGHMSREMTPEEARAFEQKFGYPPTRVVVALDALAVYVNANNPIRQLTLEQVDAIFSTTRKAGWTQEVKTWGDLGLEKEWAARPIEAFGRDEQSGTRAFFREHVLKKGEFKPEVKALADQFAVVEAPAVERGAISYGPLQHAVRLVRAVPLVDFNASEAVAPTMESIAKRRYPLTRFLYLYVNKAPGRPLDPTLHAFLNYVLSRQGQARVAQFGAIALPGDMARQNLGKVR